MNFTVENIESGLARLELEDGQFIEVLSIWLPATVRIGDCISAECDGQGLVQFSPDPKATQGRLERANQLHNKLVQGDGGGEVKL